MSVGDRDNSIDKLGTSIMETELAVESIIDQDHNYIGNKHLKRKGEDCCIYQLTPYPLKMTHLVHHLLHTQTFSFRDSIDTTTKVHLK